MVIGFMMISMLLMNIPILVFFNLYYHGGTENIGCFFNVPRLSHVEKYILIEFSDRLIAYEIPCFLLFTFNMLIIGGVWSAKKKAKYIKTSSDSSSLISLLFVSLLYLITTLPYLIVWGVNNYYSYLIGEFIGFSPTEVQVLLMIGFFTTSFSMINYSCNFLIYAWSLKFFQTELKGILRLKS